MFIIQITGGRKFTLGQVIYDTLKPLVDEHGPANIIVRHGGAAGADSLSHFQARRLGIADDHIQVRKPDWKLGLAAGNIRNIEMLEEEPTPNVVLSFPDPESRGTWNMMGFARDRGIDVELIPLALDPDDEKMIQWYALIANKPGTDIVDSIAVDIEFGLGQEQSAAMFVADEIWPGSVVSRLPEYSDLDFVVTWRGNVVAFLEIKARRNSINDYNSTIIPLRKHQIAQNISKQLHIQTIAIIVFTDALVSFHLENTPDDIQYIEREDRDKGMEHAFYNHSRFTFHMRKEQG